MNKPKYLYIDDENGTSEFSTINGFNDLNVVVIERFNLSDFRDFGSLKLELIRLFKAKEFDGLIIDLRLDGTGESRTEFNANAITSELRSVSSRGEIKYFPVILCSTEEKIKQTYVADKTSHDLYDYKISKSNPSPNWEKISVKLKSLAIGYSWIQSDSRKIEEIIGIEDVKLLDERILERLMNFSVSYDYTNFIIKNFFHQTNPLINEKILAARLGIDLKETLSESWAIISQKILCEIKYSGLFHDGWDRWWASKLNDWFESSTDQRLVFLDADQRVAQLRDLTGLEGLVSAKPLKYCQSTQFWTICEGYRTPLDPLEGFKIHTTFELKSWQESKYISLYAILEREGFFDRGLKPHVSEIERIEFTKQELGIQ